VIVVVEVGVALRRPPRVDRISRVVVSVDTPSDGSRLYEAEQEARLVATYVATGRPDVVMAVSAAITHVIEI
jgi:hypothetical protein